MKTIAKLLTIPLMITLLGCGEKIESISKKGVFKGYQCIIQKNKKGRCISIGGRELNQPSLHARDRDEDGRFDEIYIKCPKGHSLEQYANLYSLEQAYKEIETFGEGK